MNRVSDFMNIDTDFMQTALALAGRGIGRVAPNPAVGCVILNLNGAVVGHGWTQPGGRPHAETQAIACAGDKCRGGTAYVTLEPCDHQGKTPPCSKALINAGIKRVVIACKDPDPRVAGKGIQRLKAAGLEVTFGVLEDQARTLNAGFMMVQEQGRPLFTLKSATSLDGRIATRTGHSQWITGPRARAAGHMLRARHDAIMVGIGTALADNPSLTCRLPGMAAYSPTRIVADSTLKLPISSPLVQTARQIPTVIVTAKGGDKTKIQELKKLGVILIEIATPPPGHPTPAAMAQALVTHGLTRVLIEGGGKLAGAFMDAGLVDRLAWFHAAKIIGGDGVPSVAPYGVESLSDATSFQRTAITTCGEDIFETYERKGSS